MKERSLQCARFRHAAGVVDSDATSRAVAVANGSAVLPVWNNGTQLDVMTAPSGHRLIGFRRTGARAGAVLFQKLGVSISQWNALDEAAVERFATSTNIWQGKRLGLVEGDLQHFINYYNRFR